MEKRAGMDDAVLEAKLRDAVRIAERGRPHFVGFLDERQAGVAQTIMRRTGFSNYLLWGGYAEAERVLFGAFPDYLEACPEEFPLETVTVSYRQCDSLTHRDFFGIAAFQRRCPRDDRGYPGRTWACGFVRACGGYGFPFAADRQDRARGSKAFTRGAGTAPCAAYVCAVFRGGGVCPPGLHRRVSRGGQPGKSGGFDFRRIGDAQSRGGHLCFHAGFRGG